MPEIETFVGSLRRKRGISANRLAEAVGVSRQTIYAMEAETYVPNTAIALRLARVLDSTVEELFSLSADAAGPPMQSESAVMLPGSEALEAHQTVQLCRVDKRLMASAPSPVPWYFPAADAVVAVKRAQRPPAGKTRVQILGAEGEFANRILVAGCDPGVSVLARHARTAGIELVLAHRNSSQALALLKQRCIHVAGTHLQDETASNLPEVSRLFPKDSVAVISFAVWEQGIVTARNNPKSIRGIEDFCRRDVGIVNREEGSGIRVLLDSRLKRLQIAAADVRGFSEFAPGHLAAAWQVRSRAVDCCLSTRAAARAFGLHFIPLVSERYDLVIRRHHLDLPRMQNLLDTLCRSDFRRELEGMGGYDTRVTGQRLL